MLKDYIFRFLLFSFIFFTSNSEAREPLPPRFSANAYTGVYTVGQADLMVSLDGDQQHNLYVDPQGAYGTDEQWYGDVGLGYRWITNDAAIIGGYLFAGHSQVENESGFWIVNPGLEVMGRRWDARVNAYIPVAGRSHELGQEELNTVSTPFFTGHTEVINSVFNIDNAIQQIGNGADARVGYQLFQAVPLKGYLGAYFFSIANADNVRGGAAGMEYWFDETIRVFANYSYDNYQHSKVVGGLGISFGGVRKGHWADPSLSERLTDPVERYLANLGHGSGIASKTVLYPIGRGSHTVLISNSIAFFSQGGQPNTGGNLTLANCTFENPCGPNAFSQAGVNSLNAVLPNTQLFFNGGTYPAVNGVNPLVLNNGQSVFSRTANYSAPANGTARSTFNGGFILPGNNTLDGVILNNTAGIDIGIEGSGNLLINNSQIGSASNSFDTGISIAENGSLRLENSVINSNEDGIELENASLVMQSSVINSGNATASVFPTGIDLLMSNAEINDSQINVIGSPGNDETIGISSAVSSVAINQSNINVTNLNLNASTEGLVTLGGGSITMEGGTLSVSGGSSPQLTAGSDISLIEVACILSGSPTGCS